MGSLEFLDGQLLGLCPFGRRAVEAGSGHPQDGGKVSAPSRVDLVQDG
jgi:hypothetical protein